MADHAPHGRQGFELAGDYSPDEIEAGRLLFARPCAFAWAATAVDGLPPPDRAELAFAGRSNVGKSSLLNALTGQDGLARTSHTPGRTQALNFFRLDERLVLVDMPGHGYAQAPKDLVKRWQGLIAHYLRGRVTLKRLLLLIDARHGPKDSDRALMTLLDQSAVPFQIVLTKIDKVGVKALAALKDKLRAELARHPAAFPRLHATSAHKGTGIAELRAELAGLL
jgi:GTP-binding protein